MLERKNSSVEVTLLFILCFTCTIAIPHCSRLLNADQKHFHFSDRNRNSSIISGVYISSTCDPVFPGQFVLMKLHIVDNYIRTTAHVFSDCSCSFSSYSVQIEGVMHYDNSIHILSNTFKQKVTGDSSDVNILFSTLNTDYETIFSNEACFMNINFDGYTSQIKLVRRNKGHHCSVCHKVAESSLKNIPRLYFKSDPGLTPTHAHIAGSWFHHHLTSINSSRSTILKLSKNKFEKNTFNLKLDELHKVEKVTGVYINGGESKFASYVHILYLVESENCQPYKNCYRGDTSKHTEKFNIQLVRNRIYLMDRNRFTKIYQKCEDEPKIEPNTKPIIMKSFSNFKNNSRLAFLQIAFFLLFNPLI